MPPPSKPASTRRNTRSGPVSTRADGIISIAEPDGLRQLLARNAVGRHLAGREIDVDLLVLGGDQIGLLDAGNRENAFAHLLDDLLHLRGWKSSPMNAYMKE